MPNKFPVPTPTRFRVSVNPKPLPHAESISAFRACYERFEECLEFKDSHSASPLMEAASTFVLDFEIAAKRAIGSDSLRYRLFQLFYLKNVSRLECRSKLALNEWVFASEIRSIEQEVGQAFCQAGLFPVTPYFTESTRRLDKLAA